MTSACAARWAEIVEGIVAVIVVLLTTATFAAMTSTVTVAPARNPVPVMMTGVERAVEPVDGEIAVTVSAVGGAGGSRVGPDGDGASQAAEPIANANSHTPRWVLVVMNCPLLFRKRKSGARR
jgi:hypothetical protein